MTLLRRASVLRACREGPKSRRDLVQETDHSRTTAYRATVELEEQGLLEKDRGGYRATNTGAALSYAVESYLDSLDAIDRLEPLFERVSHPELLANAHMLADADLTVADDDNKYRANDRILDLCADAGRVRSGMTGSGSRHCMDGAARIAAEGDTHIEMVFRSEIVPSREHLGDVDSSTARFFEHVDAYSTEDVPFTFLLFDDRAGIVGHDHVGLPVVFAETEDQRAYQWLADLYADIRASATAVERTLQAAD